MAGLAEIQATTWENREKKPADAVADNVALMFRLRKKKRIITIPGGRVIWENIRIAQNAYVQRIDPNEEFVIGYNQTLTGFEFSPKIILVPVIINELEKAQNQGDDAFLDLLDERNDVAEASLQNNMELDLQGDGTGFSGKAFAGIMSYFVTSTSTGSIGGLSRGTYSAIRNAAVNAVTFWGSATDSSNIESRLRYMVGLVSRNADRPDICLAGDTYFNAAADAMSAKQRFTRDQEMYEAGFDNVIIEGMIMVRAGGKVFSGLARIADDRCYGINSSTIALKMYRGYNMQPLPKRVSVNQLVECAVSVGIGQLTTNNPGLNFVMYDS